MGRLWCLLFHWQHFRAAAQKPGWHSDMTALHDPTELGPLGIANGDTMTIAMAKPHWWHFRARARWRRMRALLGTYDVVNVSSSTIRLDP